MRKVVLPCKLALACLLFAACVTINVYFPAAAAEKAADQIIDQVTGSSPATTSKTPPQTRSAPAPQTLLRTVAAAILESLVPAAHAQGGANLDVDSPEVRAITASMTQRFQQLEKYFASGAAGYTADGLVEVRDEGAVPLPRGALRRDRQGEWPPGMGGRHSPDLRAALGRARQAGLVLPGRRRLEAEVALPGRS